MSFPTFWCGTSKRHSSLGWLVARRLWREAFFGFPLLLHNTLYIYIYVLWTYLDLLFLLLRLLLLQTPGWIQSWCAGLLPQMSEALQVSLSVRLVTLYSQGCWKAFTDESKRLSQYLKCKPKWYFSHWEAKMAEEHQCQLWSELLRTVQLSGKWAEFQYGMELPGVPGDWETLPCGSHSFNS